MTKEKVIQTLIDDYSKQAKLSKREQTIFKHGLLTGIEIGPMEEPEVDLEKEFYDFLDTLIGKDNGHLSEDELFRIAEFFYELGLKA